MSDEPIAHIDAYEQPEVPVIRSYFARWIRLNGQESAIHWFRSEPDAPELVGPACGTPINTKHRLILPIEPVLSCQHCIDAIRKRDAS